MQVRSFARRLLVSSRQFGTCWSSSSPGQSNSLNSSTYKANNEAYSFFRKSKDRRCAAAKRLRNLVGQASLPKPGDSAIAPTRTSCLLMNLRSEARSMMYSCPTSIHKLRVTRWTSHSSSWSIIQWQSLKQYGMLNRQAIRRVMKMRRRSPHGTCCSWQWR